jgi:hypothetical protein
MVSIWMKEAVLVGEWSCRKVLNEVRLTEETSVLPPQLTNMQLNQAGRMQSALPKAY